MPGYKKTVYTLLCLSLGYSTSSQITWEDEAYNWGSSASPEPAKWSWGDTIPGPAKSFASNAIARAGRPTNLSPQTAIAVGIALFVFCAIVYKLIQASGDGGALEKSPFSGLNFTFTLATQDSTVASRILRALMRHWYTIGWLGVRMAMRMHVASTLRKQYNTDAQEVLSGDKTAMDLHNAKYKSSDFGQSLPWQMLQAISPELSMIGLLMGGKDTSNSTDPAAQKAHEAQTAQLCDKLVLISNSSIGDVCNLCSALSEVSGYSATIAVNVDRFTPLAFNLPGSFSAASFILCVLIFAYKCLTFAWTMFAVSEEKERATAKVRFCTQLLGPQYKRGLEYMFGSNSTEQKT